MKRETILSDQIENNPDRPPVKHRKIKKRAVPPKSGDAQLPPPSAHKWECNKCGRDYVERPEKCTCGGASFIWLNLDGSGQSDMKSRG